MTAHIQGLLNEAITGFEAALAVLDQLPDKPTAAIGLIQKSILKVAQAGMDIRTPSAATLPPAPHVPAPTTSGLPTTRGEAAWLLYLHDSTSVNSEHAETRAFNRADKFMAAMREEQLREEQQQNVRPRR